MLLKTFCPHARFDVDALEGLVFIMEADGFGCTAPRMASLLRKAGPLQVVPFTKGATLRTLQRSACCICKAVKGQGKGMFIGLGLLSRATSSPARDAHALGRVPASLQGVLR